MGAKLACTLRLLTEYLSPSNYDGDSSEPAPCSKMNRRYFAPQRGDLHQLTETVQNSHYKSNERKPTCEAAFRAILGTLGSQTIPMLTTGYFYVLAHLQVATV